MNEISRRSLLRGAGAAGLGAVALGVLSACGVSSSTPNAVKSGAAALKFWTHDPGYVKTFNAAIADKSLVGGLPYQYSLKVTQAAADQVLSRAISQASAGGTTPELIGVVIDQFPRVMKNNIAADLFEDLSPLVSKFGDKLVKKAPYTVDGKLYALESDVSLTVQYYREDVFSQNGISTDIATWDDWIEAGAELNAKTGQFLGMHANGDNGAIFNSFLQLFLQRGGQPFDKNGKLTLDSQEAVDALTFMQDSLKKKAFVALSDPYGSSAAAALKNSQLVAIAMPNWYNVYGLQANAPEQAGKWKIRVLPKFSQGGGTASTLGGTGFAVGKDKPLSEAAKDLLEKTYLTKQGQLIRFQQGGYLPTLTDLYEDQDFLSIHDKYLDQNAFEIYAKGVGDVPSFYQNENMPILSTAAGQPILGVQKGTLEPKAAVDAIVKAYNQQANK